MGVKTDEDRLKRAEERWHSFRVLTLSHTARTHVTQVQAERRGSTG